MSGLPRLLYIQLEDLDTDRVTLVGIRALAHVVAKKCPKCDELLVNDDYRDAVFDIVLSKYGADA